MSGDFIVQLLMLEVQLLLPLLLIINVFAAFASLNLDSFRVNFFETSSESRLTPMIIFAFKQSSSIRETSNAKSSKLISYYLPTWSLPVTSCDTLRGTNQFGIGPWSALWIQVKRRLISRDGGNKFRCQHWVLHFTIFVVKLYLVLIKNTQKLIKEILEMAQRLKRRKWNDFRSRKPFQ